MFCNHTGEQEERHARGTELAQSSYGFYPIGNSFHPNNHWTRCSDQQCVSLKLSFRASNLWLPRRPDHPRKICNGLLPLAYQFLLQFNSNRFYNRGKFYDQCVWWNVQLCDREIAQERMVLCIGGESCSILDWTSFDLADWSCAPCFVISSADWLLLFCWFWSKCGPEEVKLCKQ